MVIFLGSRRKVPPAPALAFPPKVSSFPEEISINPPFPDKLPCLAEKSPKTAALSSAHEIIVPPSPLFPSVSAFTKVPLVMARVWALGIISSARFFPP